VLQVLLPAWYPGQGGRSATRLSVCRRSQDGRDRGGGVQWILTNATTDVPCQQLNFRAAAIRIFEKYITYTYTYDQCSILSPKKRFFKSSPALRKIFIYIMVKVKKN